MNNIQKLFGGLLVAPLALALMSCGNDNPEYTPAEAESTPGVYFSDEASSTIELSSEETSFEVTVYRINTDDAITVPITATGTEDLFDVPSSVSFSQGESETALVITYDPDMLDYDYYCEITLTIDEDYASLYALSFYTFSVGIPAPWESLGNCTFTEDFMTTFYAIDPSTYEVEIQENSLQEGFFRLVNPFGAAYPWNEEGDWDDSQDWYFEIHAEDPEGVYIELQETGMDWGYGNVIMGSLAAYYMDMGYTLEEEKAYGETGTYADGVITFPTNCLLICMPDYSSSYYYANTNGAFQVVMPGITVADYDLAVTYDGQYTDSDDEPAGVIANVTEYGADLEYVLLALVEGSDVDDSTVEAITDGSISSTQVSAAGSAMIAWNDTPVTGTYTIVAVGYADGEAVATETASFKYSEPTSETWTAYYVGDYEYYYFWEGTDSGLTLYQSDDDETRWKIEHWGYDVDFIFTFDQTTGEVLVEDQEVGYEYASYGMVYVVDMVTYMGGDTSMGYSYYDNGVFYFNVIYYCSAGYFGYGYETFTLTGNAAAKVHNSTTSTKTIDNDKTLVFDKKFVRPNAKKVE